MRGLSLGQWGVFKVSWKEKKQDHSHRNEDFMFSLMEVPFPRPASQSWHVLGDFFLVISFLNLPPRCPLRAGCGGGTEAATWP